MNSTVDSTGSTGSTGSTRSTDASHLSDPIDASGQATREKATGHAGSGRDEPNEVIRGVIRLYRALWQYSAGHRLTLFAALALLFSSQVVKLAVPYVAGQAINTLQVSGIDGLPVAGSWLAGLFTVTVASWLLHGPGRVLERNVALVVRDRVSARLVDKLLTLPLAWHDANHSGSATHRVQQSSRALYDFSQSQFIYLQNMVRLVGPVVALTLLDPWVGTIAVIGLVVITVSISGFDRAMIRLAHSENDRERRYASILIDSVANILTVKALRQARALGALVALRLQDIYVPLKRAIVVNESKWCAVDLSSQALCCLLLALYAWRAASGAPDVAPTVAGAAPPTLALGNLYMVWEYSLQAAGVITAVAAQFQSFARQHADYASGDDILEASSGQLPAQSTAADAATAMATATPAATATAAPIHPSPAHHGPTGWQRLRIVDLQFSHAGTEEGLTDLNLDLVNGQRYALIGGSGAGKSTLLLILAGLYDADGGCWQIDESAAMGPAQAALWLRGQSTLIAQQTEVIQASLADNLALCETVSGAPDSARFGPALAAACATDFVSADTAGLAMPLSERGSNWSGGQRQRIALARGLLAAENSSIVLLDEPTAALDSQTEQRVLTNLLDTLGPACVVASLHRLHLLKHFDAVILMDRGRIVAQGSIEEVAATSRAFRALVAAGLGSADEARS